MVRIRLQRVGAKNQPSYRVVVIDSRAPRDSSYIDRIGHYNPLTNPETVTIEQAKATKWLQQGAQPSDAVARLFAKLGLMTLPPKTWKEKPAAAPQTAATAPETPAAVPEAAK